MIHDHGWEWDYLNANNLISSGPNGFNGISNERYWRRISDCMCISKNLLQIFYSQQNYTFRGAKSGSNFCKYLKFSKKRHFCGISQKIPENQKSAGTRKLSRNL